MCRAGDLFPQPVTSVDQLLAVAHAMARATETRYQSLAEPTRPNGDVGLKPLFVHLAENAGRHVAQITQRSRSLCGRAPDPALVRQPLPKPFDEESAHSALLTPYRALANAVIDEERTFAFHTYIAAQAPNEPVRKLAEEFAKETLNHAALLRRERRQAFHAERPRSASLPQTVTDLHALASERNALASYVYAALARRCAVAGNTCSADIFRHLAEDEGPGRANLLDDDRTIGTETITEGVRILEQAFEYYINIAKQAESELLMAEAQHLAEQALRRLVLAHSARGDAPAPTA